MVPFLLTMLVYQSVGITLMPHKASPEHRSVVLPGSRHQAQAEGLDLFAQAPILVTWICEVYFPKDPWDEVTKGIFTYMKTIKQINYN